MNPTNSATNPISMTGLTKENLPAVAHAATHIPNFVWVEPSPLDHVIAVQGVPTPLNSSVTSSDTYTIPLVSSPHPPMTIPIRDGSTNLKDAPLLSRKMEKSIPPPPLARMPPTPSKPSEFTSRSAPKAPIEDDQTLYTEDFPRSSLGLSPHPYVPTSTSANLKSNEKAATNAVENAASGASHLAKDVITGTAHVAEGVAVTVARGAVDVAIGTATMATQVAVGAAVAAVDIASAAAQSVPFVIGKALGVAHEVANATKEAYDEAERTVAPSNLALNSDWSDRVDFTFRKQRTPTSLLVLEDNERRDRVRRGVDPILLGKHARFVLKPLHEKFRANPSLVAKEVSHPWTLTSFAGRVLGKAAHAVHDVAFAPAHMVQNVIGTMSEERGDIAVDLDMVEERERNRRMNDTIDPIQSAHKRQVERELLSEITPKHAL